MLLPQASSSTMNPSVTFSSCRGDRALSVGAYFSGGSTLTLHFFAGKLDLKEAEFLTANAVLTPTHALTLAGVSELAPFVKDLHDDASGMERVGELGSLAAASPFQPFVSNMLDDLESAIDELFSDSLSDALVKCVGM
jgi:hypothetical protein